MKHDQLEGGFCDEINEKNHPEAQDMIDYVSTPFTWATQAVKAAILNLKREAGL